MTGYIGINQSGVQNITNLISNGSLASNTTSWTMASTYYTTTQYSGYIGSVVTTTSSTPRYHTQSFTSVSGSTAATKQILYCQAMVCGKPSNVSTPTVRVRQYKNGSSTATYTNLSSSTSSSISCNFSSINMSSLPSGGYAYAKINNGSTQYTSGTVTISKGDTITIYLDRTSNNGNAGVYLYRDKGAAIVASDSMAGNVGETSDMPDYHEWGNSLTYTWDSDNAPYDFMTVNITFENESTGYLNCFIKLVQAWNKNSTYLETYDGTDYYSYDRVEFAMASTSTANDTIFVKNIFIVNLTAKFGAGNEPTKVWCDENLQFNTSNNTISYLSNELVPIARQIKGLYVGIGNVAKQAKKAYVGINGIAKLWYSSTLEISYTGNYTDEIVTMDGSSYRLLTLTSSGTLTTSATVTGDIWICGGGGSGNTGSDSVANYNQNGGAGAYAETSSNISFQSLVVTIGAGNVAGSGAYGMGQGGGTSISGDITLSAQGGINGGGTDYGTMDRSKGGTGGGILNTWGWNQGDGLPKMPFGSSYFSYPYCDGGGAGGYYESTSDRQNGGAGGTNGSDGGVGSSGGYIGGAGGGHYGGKGGNGATTGKNGSAGTGYGSGGGGAGFRSTSGTAGSGYQGVCFIRIPISGGDS